MYMGPIATIMDSIRCNSRQIMSWYSTRSQNPADKIPLVILRKGNPCGSPGFPAEFLWPVGGENKLRRSRSADADKKPWEVFGLDSFPFMQHKYAPLPSNFAPHFRLLYVRRVFVYLSNSFSILRNSCRLKRSASGSSFDSPAIDESWPTECTNVCGNSSSLSWQGYIVVPGSP